MIKSKHRNELIEKIKNIQDPNVLEEIYRLLDINIDESTYKLSDQQKKEIAQARNEINRGEGIPSHQVDKEIDECLIE
jgi:hypothetical protein